MTDKEQPELETALEQQSALVGPILSELFAKGATKGDYWLKGASTQILSDWIIGLQNIASLLERQLTAAGEVIAAQSDELEKLRPEKKQIWTPFG